VSRRSARGRRLFVLLGVAALALVLVLLVPRAPAQDPLVRQGRQLFVEGCSSCHGLDARGVTNQGPSLYGAGAGAADFYLRTGRMPLDAPGKEPLRSPPRYPDSEIRALDAYVGSLGGPSIPSVDPAKGSVARGRELFQSNCAGCHSTGAAGGVAPGALLPSLADATPTQVGEAVRTGPFVMPRFSRRQLDSRDVDDVARYVQLTQDPVDRGGWSIGHIGPVPEGLAAWAIGAVALLVIARLIGEGRR
jgi:quinol---cytochrome-c reductase cytochrome c subunit